MLIHFFTIVVNCHRVVIILFRNVWQSSRTRVNTIKIMLVKEVSKRFNGAWTHVLIARRLNFSFTSDSSSHYILGGMMWRRWKFPTLIEYGSVFCAVAKCFVSARDHCFACCEKFWKDRSLLGWFFSYVFCLNGFRCSIPDTTHSMFIECVNRWTRISMSFLTVLLLMRLLRQFLFSVAVKHEINC